MKMYVSQNMKILEYLQKGNSITQLEALRLFGCLRLAGRILNLRERGHVISTQWEVDPKSRKRWARYHLVQSRRVKND